MLQLLGSLIGPDKVGGWVRGGVAAGLAVLISKWPALASILDPITQAAIGTVASGIVVGVWSQFTKTDAAKVTMAANVPSVTQIKVTDPQLAADTPKEVVLSPTTGM